MEINNIGEYFGTLQITLIKTWREHLKTNKYSKHMALDEFYDEIPELLDALIEQYIGVHGEVKDYKNIYDTEDVDAREYLRNMRDFVMLGRDKFFKEESELCSDVDAILSLMDQTLYKLEQLVEGLNMKSLREFLCEKMEQNEEANITEAFKSPLLQGLIMNLPKSTRDSRYNNNMLMFDKVTDADITEVLPSEAEKMARSRKNPAYVIWQDNRNNVAITWGYDVIVSSICVNKGANMDTIAYNATKAYIISDPNRFLRGDIRQKRRDAKEGAEALKSAAEVLEENKDRYNKILAQMKRDSMQKDVIDLFKEVNELMKNIYSKHIDNYIKVMQEDGPSFWNIKFKIDKINKLYNEMLDSFDNVRMFNNPNKVEEYAAKIKTKAEEIKEAIANYEQEL